jgi:hypothetical protein
MLEFRDEGWRMKDDEWRIKDGECVIPITFFFAIAPILLCERI